MRRVLFAVTASLLLVGSASARDAAQLTDVRGTVLVGTEKGFQQVSGPTKLQAGDRVVLSSDASVVLSYGQDCSMALPANSDITISEQSCTIGTQSGPFSMLEPIRPLGWGILMGIATFIGVVVSM
jgi:hypothetical protein